MHKNHSVMQKDYISNITKALSVHNDSHKAEQMSAYLKGKFAFYGINAPERREAVKYLIAKDNLPDYSNAVDIIRELWDKDEREYQYVGQEILWKHKRNINKDTIDLIEYMIVNKSWWDTVDFIATKVLAEYLRRYPEERKPLSETWGNSGNIWLVRSTIIFQLKYKSDTDAELLADNIRRALGTNEFFINKAIGWALREYSKTDPEWVRGFLEEHSLSRLSVREASKYL